MTVVYFILKAVLFLIAESFLTWYAADRMKIRFPLGALPHWVEQNGVYGKNCGRNRKKGLRFPGKIVYIIMIGCFLI